jgi:NAD(P)-dependent dehydrogenase (short-subunit alcohol dehydrogenase family)
MYRDSSGRNLFRELLQAAAPPGCLLCATLPLSAAAAAACGCSMGTPRTPYDQRRCAHRVAAARRISCALAHLQQPADPARALQQHQATATPAAAAAAAATPLHVAVTGASSGIGLEFVRQYAEAGARVYALCRNPAGAAELAEVAAAAPPGSVSLHAHDQDSAESCAAVATEFAGVPLDTLINNAGVGGSPGARSRTSDFGQEGQQFGSIDYAAWADTMNTNVLGVMRTIEALTPSLLLSDSPRLVHICGVFGSLTNQVRVGEASPDMAERSGSGGYFIYRSSKAAMNMVAKMLDVELAPLGMYITRCGGAFLSLPTLHNSLSSLRAEW